jgi:uncharacterized protein (DUF2252 family)
MGKLSPGVLSEPREVLTSEEWHQLGRKRRKFLPRSSHAEWAPPSGRPDPVGILEEQAKERVPDLVPIRHGRMASSPFAYFRGAAAPMAWDLGHLPSTDIRVQCCGDAHLLNFGMFGAPDRQLVFDVNDFDETLPGPFEWDVKRLAASVAVAARENGFDARAERIAARRCAHVYRTEMANFAQMRFLDVWYSRIDVDQVCQLFDAVQSRKAIRRRNKDVQKAYRRTSVQAVDKLCHLVDGQYRIKPMPPVVVRFGIESEPTIVDELRAAVDQYQETLQADRREVLRHYYFGDFARKVVGVGSVGTEAFILLLLGDRADEPLFLQLKEAQESVLAPFAGPGEYKHQGERVVRGQNLMQAAGDPFLGWTSGLRMDGAVAKEYYVRQLRDMKGAMNVPIMDPPQLTYYAGLCGWALARSHARTGRAAMISGYLGSSDQFDRAIEEFAVAYAEQNQLDYQRLLNAIECRRLPTIEGL